MKTYTKDEVKEVFGEQNVLARKILVGKVGYVSGIPGFDTLKLMSLPQKGAAMNVDLRPKGIVFEVLKGFSYTRAGLPLEDIDYIVIEHQQQILEKKEKSVIGRAVVGGLLLGPIGAIVGGISGIGTKTVQASKDLPDNVMIIAYTKSD